METRMNSRPHTTIWLCAALVAAAGLPRTIWAYQPTDSSSTPAPAPAGAAVSPEAAAQPPAPPAPPPATPAATPPGTGLITLNFKDTPLDQVIDFFAREAGLPVIFEAAVPAGALTFLSPQGYSFEDALSILNLNLATRGVQLRRQDKFLYLNSLTDAAKKPGQVVTELPPGVRPDEILTMAIPLNHAVAATVVEQIKPLLGAFGVVVPIPQQNMVLVTDSAAQVRRIREIVASVDQQKVADAQYRIFPLKHAQAEVITQTLRGLLAQRVVTTLVQADGKRVTVQDDQMGQLNLQPDARTNSIVAVGTSARIKVVEEMITLLDVPATAEGGPGSQMVTIALSQATAADAAARLGELFKSQPEPKKPTIIPLPQVNKIMLMGPADQIQRAMALLTAIDPGVANEGGSVRAETRAAVVRLRYGRAAEVSQTVARLLTPRQANMVKLAPTPDGRGLVIHGPGEDTEIIEKIVTTLDVSSNGEREVAVVRIDKGAVAEVVRAADGLYQATGNQDKEPVSVNTDEASRSVVLIGSKAGLAAYQKMLETAQGNIRVPRTGRMFDLTRATPSVLAARLAKLSRPMLQTDEAVPFVEPVFEPIDDLRKLMVRAQPEQITVIEQLVQRFDVDEPGTREIRVVKLPPESASGIIERAKKLYAERSAGLPPEQAGEVTSEYDAASGNAIFTGRATAMRIFSESLTQAQQLTPPVRTTRLIDIRQAKASDVLPKLNELLKAAPVPAERELPAVTISALDQTNSLVVTAEEVQHALVADFVRRLDRIDQKELPPIQLLQLRTAEADKIAAMLNQRYGERSPEERANKPVDVKSDAATNTLIVTAHPEPFEQIKSLVEDLNKDKGAGQDKVTRLFPLKVAKAVDIAAALDKLYPQPPVPVDRLGRPQPWLQQPKPVLVSSDAATNSLVVYAPADQMDSIRDLAEKLDKVELPPQAELRTYRVAGASLETVRTTLQNMISRGVLTGATQPGKPPVQIVVDAEPRSSTLIVAGDAQAFGTVEKILKELSAVPAERTLRVYPVTNARATELARKAAELYAAQTTGDPTATAAEITGDDNASAVNIVADAVAMPRVVRILEELSKQQGPAREIRMLSLKLAKAEEVVRYLDELLKGSRTLNISGGPSPVFEAIPTTNSVMVAATSTQLAVIEALVKGLDASRASDRPPMRILKVTSSDAANLAQVLQQAYSQRTPEAIGKHPVEIQADAATNTLLISAHPEIFPEIEKVVLELNETQTLDKSGREIRIFPLTVARAEDLAQTIDQMFPEPPIPLDPRTRQPRPDLKQPREVVVRADKATNSLIVDAPSRRLSGFEEIVRRLDQAKVAGNAEVRTYKIERADLTALTTTLRGLVSANALPGAAPTTPVTVSSEPISRTIVVSAPQESFATIEKVIKDTDAEAASQPGIVRMYALKNARVGQLQPVIERLLMIRVAADAPRDATAADLQRLFAVAADSPTNTVLISGSESVQKAAEQLIMQLDQAGSESGQAEVRVFRLDAGDAQSVASSLQSSLSAASQPTEPKPQVTAEVASNAVIISASRRQLDEVEKLIRSMDQMAKPDMLAVRTINLKFARAESVQPVIESVLTQESMLDMLPPAQRAQVISRGGLTMQPKVRVAAEPRLNALVVSGPKALLDLAEQMVKDLDLDPTVKDPKAGSRSVRVLSLQNADAAEIAKSLEAVFKDDPAGVPPTIQVDASSNSLIIRADATQLSTIDEVVRKVDQASLAGNRQIKMIPLDKSKADAQLIAETLRRMVEKQGGSKVEVISIEELVRRQQEKNPPRKPGAMLELRHPKPIMRTFADAGSHPLFTAMASAAFAAPLAPSQPSDQPAAGNDPAKDEPGVTIAVDPATNSLMIVGSPRTTEQLAELAAMLQDQMPGDPATVRVVTLPAGIDQQSLSQLVGQTITTIGRRSATNPGGFTGPVSLLPDPTGNALVVLSNSTDFETIGSLIAGVAQVSGANQLTIKVYPLNSVSARQAEDAVRDLLTPSPTGTQARRVRSAEVSVMGPDGKPLVAKLDPALVRVSAGPGGASLIVSAPAEAIAILDRFVTLLDQSPGESRMAIRRYELKNARAADLARTFQTLFDAQQQGPGNQEAPKARFIADDRANALLVTASSPQHDEVTRLLATADLSLEDKQLETAILSLQTASPVTVQRIIEQVVIGRDPAKRDRIRVSAEEGSSLLALRAPKEDIAEIRELIAQVDSAEVSGLPVRSIKLERADAQQTAQALTQFYTQRAQVSAKPGQRTANRVAIIGDRRTGTIVVASSDEDFAQIKELATSFDQPAPIKDMQFKVIPLRNARISEIQSTVTNLIDEFKWTGGRDGENRADKVFIQTNERTNSLVVMGDNDVIATVERIVTQLDVPEEGRTKLAIRAVGVQKADLRTVKNVIEQAFSTPGWRSWRGVDPDGVRVEIDPGRRSLVLVGKEQRVAEAQAYIEELERASGRGDTKIESIPLNHARADRAASSLRSFFTERARAQGLAESPVSIMGSADGNVLVVSADEANLAVIRELLTQIDADNLGSDRRTEIYVLQNTTATEASNTLRTMFPRAGKEEERVVITPQPSQNSLLISAPIVQFDQIAALVRQLDAAPKPEQANIQTITLNSARAQEVATALKQALPQNVKIAITAVARSNSLMLTGSNEAIALALEQIGKLDTEKPKALTVFRRFKLENASADDLAFTVRQMLSARPRGDGEPTASVDYNRSDNTLMIAASADAMPEVEKMIQSLDLPPDKPRRMDFIKLDYAKAEQTAKALENFYGRFAFEASPAARNVTIIPDPASNSLVISAEESVWAGIRELLKKLDTKEYDTSQQSAVIALQHADAVSVARAINEGLRAPLQAELDRERIRIEREARGQRSRDRDEFLQPSVLIDAQDIPTVSAEPQTNSLVVFAGPKMLERIQSLVRQLDVPALANINDIRLIPLKAGKPSAIAQQIRTLFLNDLGNERDSKIRGVLIVGEDTAGALIVRAPDDKFAQIKALAESLQTAVDAGRVLPHVFRLANVPAARIAPTIQRTFAPIAQQMGETIGVEIERGSNSLVVACSERLKAEVEKTLRELDVATFGVDGKPAAGGMGQSVLIVDLVNNAPTAVQKMLDDMGLTKPQPADRPGVVSEPVTIVPMVTRSALAILASPGDGPAIVELVKALDATPPQDGETVTIVRLKRAAAQDLAATLTAMLDQSRSANKAGPVPALAEQLRRIKLTRSGLGQEDLDIDLSKPIRLVPDNTSNSLVVGSTPGNIAALIPVIEMLDTLPLGESVLIRMFPLQNAQAARVKLVIDELFRQGATLSRQPGTQRAGEPTSTTGQALIGSVAVALDERTNTIVVAGPDEALALVEVLVKNLDSERMSNWIEPVVIQVRHGDAGAIAQRLNDVLVRGLATTPEAAGLQKQYGRLRMVMAGKDPNQPENRVEADLFAPLNGLVISSDPTLNALIVIGSAGNVAVVREMVAQLDVEAVAASNTFRILALKNAAADRAARILEDLFQQRQQTGALRPEDRLVISTDLRTNSLIISSSARSLAVVDSLVKALDSAQASPSVSLHLLPVEGADVTQLASKIQRLMRERIEAASRAGGVTNPLDAFSIEAEPSNNLLIIASSEENFGVVKELVDALVKNGEALAASLDTGLIQLKKMTVADAVTQVNDIYVKKEAERRGPNAVTVSANERLNAILVNGTAKDIQEIRALVERLESTEIALVRQLDRIELKSANSLEVVNLLENVLSGRGVGGTRLGARQATKIQYLRDQIVDELVAGDRPPTEAEIDGAIRDQVTLTPDIRTNAVLVNAPPPVLTLIREIINDLDSNKADREIAYFRLVNADAARTAEVLSRVFTLRQQGTSYVLVPRDDSANSTEETTPADTSARVTAVPDERQALSIAVDARTNTLIVSGTKRYLDQVRELVDKLDSIEAVERLQTVYHLKNAKAKEMATTLQDVFRAESSLTRSTLGTQQIGSLERQLEAEVTVVGDENSNKLLIATSPRFIDKVLKIVDELDATPPQVTIQVLLAEVTLDSEDSWGMDLRVGPFGGDLYRASYSGGGSGGIVNTLGGGNLAVSSADFSLLVRALEVQGKLQVLSRPEVMVNNNKTASIQVGDNIAVATGSERTPQGSTRADVRREDVGIILEVTPRISNDGFVQMDIAPKISSLTARTTQVSEDFSAPVINQRTLKTTVNVKDGQSVVIGGLIQSSEEDRRTKVPGLGDIPIIGPAFRTTKKSNVKTELLVILTPRVVPGAGPDWETRIRKLNDDALNNITDPLPLRQHLDEQDLRTREQRELITPKPGDTGPKSHTIIRPSLPGMFEPAPDPNAPVSIRRESSATEKSQPRRDP
jgi:type II secretion system protein D